MSDLFVTDGGLETTLIFHQGLELPSFASFVLLEDDAGREALRTYFEPYLGVARRYGAGFVLDTATWRANPDWGTQLGYTPERLAAANREAVAFAKEIAELAPDVEIVINGVVGPRGDGYVAGEQMTAEAAEKYHGEQIEAFAEAGVDLVTGVTMTYAEEAVGIVRAAGRAGLPVAISFTVETDGRLPSGQPLREAAEQLDAETDGAARHLMINCAHPTHFDGALEDGPWLERISGVRANASTKSHAELDEATELDEGDPADLAERYVELRQRLPNVNVLGGCCGTDYRHVAAIMGAWRREDTA